LDISYCFKKCLLGQATAEDILNKNHSVFDAASEFRFFIERCSKNCPFKDNITVTDKEHLE
jgi:hypothetical protein